MHNLQIIPPDPIRQGGFTIIEVLIALVIASVSIVGLINLSQNTIQSLDKRKNQVLANLVVNNVAIETRLNNRPSIGIQDDEYSLGNIDWRYTKITEQVELLDVTKTTIHIYQTLEDKSAKKPITSLELYLPTVNIEKGSSE